MSERVDICKKLMKSAFIVYDNLSDKEQQDIYEYMDSLEELNELSKFTTDDAVPCSCGAKNGSVSFDGKEYCLDCLHFMSKIQKETKDESGTV